PCWACARHPDEDPESVAAVDARGLHGRLRLAVLVPGVCSDGRRERAHAGAGRGAVRAGRSALLVEAADLAARALRYRADRDWRGAAGGGVTFCCHCGPTGPREARPDDRLRGAIQSLTGETVWIASSLALLAITED